MTNTKNWGIDLPKELIIKIAEDHINSYDDFETLRWISSHWRTAAKEAKYSSTHPIYPMLLLPRSRSATDNQLRLYSLSNRMVHRINLPRDITATHHRVRVLSSHGWLLLIAEQPPCVSPPNPTPTHLFLFNPLSAAVITLPPLTTVAVNIKRFMLSANPSNTSEYVVVLTVVPKVLPVNWSVFWRNGCDYWDKFVDHYNLRVKSDVTYYEGGFYKIGYHVVIVTRFDDSNGGGGGVSRIMYEVPLNLRGKLHYMVELDGRLVGITRVGNKQRTIKFKLFGLNANNWEIVDQIQNVGNAAIFIDSNTCFLLKLDEAGAEPYFKANCIYYTHEYYDCRNPNSSMSLYNLTSGKIEGFYDGPLITGNNFKRILWV